MKNKARVCFIGNGEFANKVHYQSLASLDDVEIVGICAFNADRLKQTALKYNISTDKIYISSSKNDYQKMLSDLHPDGVYIVGQPEAMFDIWVWCLQQKFNIFIEKPMGITLHQSRILAHLAEQNGCITQVSHQRRSAPIMELMKSKCLEKGAITHAIVEFSKFDIRPMLSARDRMLDDFTHSIDTARWIGDGEVVKIESSCKSIGVADINWIGATLHFDNGTTCYVVGNWASGRRIFRVQMHAPGICADVELEKEAILYEEGDVHGEKYDTCQVAGSEELFVFGGFRTKSIEFVESIQFGTEKTSSPFRETLKTMEVCEKILAQSLIGVTQSK
ncbi:Gfo/Idh/MocA family oxidoreductase [Reichenbachiella sp. MALMAid0571]|uniref:Gfo/Idh/MocA family protein n=1 Tax=Reichenbachiella sp. MALMAid0571 TaxID=3143939 RepID=UPI0032DFE664